MTTGPVLPTDSPRDPEPVDQTGALIHRRELYFPLYAVYIDGTLVGAFPEQHDALEYAESIGGADLDVSVFE